MTPEEIQQVVEDYRKSNLNEIFNEKTKNFLRNLGRDKRDQVNGDEDKDKKNGNGLTAKQKTLPKDLQEKIMKSKKKKKPLYKA